MCIRDRLNGRQIGECDDAFLVYRFPVGDALKEGKNHLAVRFRSCVREVADKPLSLIHICRASSSWKEFILSWNG